MRMILLTLLLPALTQAATVQHMSWDKPGANRYTGLVSTAVERYNWKFTRGQLETLKRKIAANDYDDLIEIRLNTITGKNYRYSADITYMHFGTGTVAVNVSRDKWSMDEVQMARVFCVESTDTCIAIPAVCTNVALVLRNRQPMLRSEDSSGGSGAGLHYPNWVIPQLPPVPSIVPAPTDPLPPVVPPEPAEVLRSVLPLEPQFSWPPLPAPADPPIIQPPANQIPEPSTWALSICGLIGLAFMRKKYV